MPRRLALSILFASLAACDPPEQSVAIHGVAPDLAITLRAGGEVLPHHRVRDVVTARTTATELSLTASGPCGEVTIALERVETYGDARLVYEAGPIPRRRVLIDTRDASRAPLSIGALALDLPSGVTHAIEIIAPSCPEGHAVRIGDDVVGTLAPSDEHDTLIDVRGTHCYRIDRADREVVVLTTLDATQPTETLRTLTPAHVHALDSRIDFAFAPVPSRVDLDALGPHDDHEGHYAITSLEATDCSAAAPLAPTPGPSADPAPAPLVHSPK
ncbi:MAG: hypothetical protein K1X94_18255 [Sandaracinaceae bacterium]|nr:hypothetical protein [Sandaracinaceae bacterium]